MHLAQLEGEVTSDLIFHHACIRVIQWPLYASNIFQVGQDHIVSIASCIAILGILHFLSVDLTYVDLRTYKKFTS
jgi:hypothetical protein